MIKVIYYHIGKLIHASFYWPSGKVAEYWFNRRAFERYQEELEMRGWELEKNEQSASTSLFHKSVDCQQNIFEGLEDVI